MRKCVRFFTVFITAFMLLLVSCGKADSGQKQENEEVISGENQQKLPKESLGTKEDVIALKEEHLFWYYQPMERTWEKDYADRKWENGKCLNMYVMLPDLDAYEISVIEDELNHRLYQAGYDFYLHFQGPTYDEMFGEDRLGGQNSDELVRQRHSEGENIDLWVTKDYISVVQNGEVLDLTDFLQGEEGKDVYAHYDACVWEQLTDDQGRIYGIPMNPIATNRCVYLYTPQLTEQLSIDMSDFSGDPAELEDLFPSLLEKGVLPIEVERMEDALMLSMLGMENYGGIIAVRHDGSDWEAVDLWAQKDAMTFYEQLGEWREQGFLDYFPYLLKQLREDGNQDIKDETGSSRYPYRLFQLDDRNRNSWLGSLNFSEATDESEKGATITKYYVPRQPVYISNRDFLNQETAVVSAQTAYPEECMQFLRILFLDSEIRLLLCQGIEGEHYIWEGDILKNGYAYGFAMGLGFKDDLRFWPVGGWGDWYTEEIADMNRNASLGLGVTMPYDLSGDPELSEKEAACRQIIEENRAVFIGYYGKDTAKRLEEVHTRLLEAGYQDLIAAVNAKRPGN